MSYPNITHTDQGMDCILNSKYHDMVDHDAIDAKRMKVDEQSAMMPSVPHNSVVEIVKDRVRYTVDIQGKQLAESLNCIAIY